MVEFMSFNPRPPRGRRLKISGCANSLRCFNPRPPRGRRLAGNYSTSTFQSFNPRPPRGRRRVYCTQSIGNLSFNPRPPRGRRPESGFPLTTENVSIHAPRVGGDITEYTTFGGEEFQSTPPAWEATADIDKQLAEAVFQSTPPAWEATVHSPKCSRWG